MLGGSLIKIHMYGVDQDWFCYHIVGRYLHGTNPDTTASEQWHCWQLVGNKTLGVESIVKIKMEKNGN